jgi:hypothetical protein
MRFVEDSFKRGENHHWNIFSRVVGEGKSE